MLTGQGKVVVTASNQLQGYHCVNEVTPLQKSKQSNKCFKYELGLL